MSRNKVSRNKVRKKPRKHTVHTKDPRYNVKNYSRGSGNNLVQKPRILIKKGKTGSGKVYFASAGYPGDSKNKVEYREINSNKLARSWTEVHGKGMRQTPNLPDDESWQYVGAYWSYDAPRVLKACKDIGKRYKLDFAVFRSAGTSSTNIYVRGPKDFKKGRKVTSMAKRALKTKNYLAIMKPRPNIPLST